MKISQKKYAREIRRGIGVDFLQRHYAVFCLVIALAFIVIQSDLLHAQHPFAKRIGAGGFLGHSMLVGDMNKYLQGDMFGALRIKYNFSRHMAVELTVASAKRFINRLEVPEIPIMNEMPDALDVNLNAKINPAYINVNYYLSGWDTRPYVTLGFGYYNVKSNLFVSFEEPLIDPPLLLQSIDRKSGLNAGVGMETFLIESLSFEIRAAYHFIIYGAPSTAGSFHFPIDNPGFISFSIGLTYYLN